MVVHFKNGKTYPSHPNPAKAGGKYIIHWTTIKEEKPIEVSGHVLDYDELSKEFVQALPSITAHLPTPSDIDHWNGPVGIDFTPTNPISHALIKTGGQVTYTNSSLNNTAVTVYPAITWTTHRSALGDNPPGKVYHPNGLAPGKSFAVNYGGTISRDYTYTVKVHDGHDESCSTGCTKSHYHYEEKTGTVTASFNQGYEVITVQAKVHNGINMPLQSLSRQQKEIGSKLKKSLYWEGTPYDISVLRYMRDADKNGNTIGSIAAADGQFLRYFQHIDTAEIEYKVIKSFKNNFDTDRELARDNPGGSLKGLNFVTAPFATDKQLQKYEYPIKSGYFYKPNAQYQVTINTVIYKWENKETEHKDIVNAVKNSFQLEPQMPTVLRDKSIVVDLNGNINANGKYKKYGYPVDIDENYKRVSDVIIDYKTGPGSLSEYFLNSDSVMGVIDQWLKKVPEGWNASNTINSWSSKKYREFVKNAKLHKIEEKTILTFTINPDKYSFYIMPQTKNGQYPIQASFGRFDFDIKETNRQFGGSGCGEIDNILFTIIGSMYDDSANY